MRVFIKLLPVMLCFLLMAAHFSRAGTQLLAIICLAFPLLLIWKHKISARTIQVVLFLFGLEWLRSLLNYIDIRTEYGMDWSRLAIILSVVALINFATILVFRSKPLKNRYGL